MVEVMGAGINESPQELAIQLTHEMIVIGGVFGRSCFVWRLFEPVGLCQNHELPRQQNASDGAGH